MSFEAKVLSVLIASPSDTSDAREAVERTIHAWNRDRTRSEKGVLLPLRWEVDAVPEAGNDVQALINKQLVDDADIVIALFHSRLGAPTPRNPSGTAEEIERAIDNGLKVHVYFSEMPHPANVDPEQLRALRDFRESLQARALLGRYISHEDLTTQVRTALERDVTDFLAAELPSEGPNGQPKAVLRARYESHREPAVNSKGRMRMKTVGERLVIENIGTGAAEQVDVEVEAVGQGAAPSVIFDGPIERILPQGSIKLLVAVHLGVSAQWRVILRWREGDSQFEESQTLTPF